MKEISFRDHVLPLKDKLFRMALRITLDRAEAEDVVQDTLMKLWREHETLASIDNLEAWSLTLCRNRALDIVKRSGRDNLQLDVERDSPVETTSPDSILERQEGIARVRALMNTLPEVQRSIMELRDIEGHTYQEISAILSIPESQVKVYLYRARQKVREALLKSNTQ